MKSKRVQFTSSVNYIAIKGINKMNSIAISSPTIYREMELRIEFARDIVKMIFEIYTYDQLLHILYTQQCHLTMKPIQ